MRKEIKRKIKISKGDLIVYSAPFLFALGFLLHSGLLVFLGIFCPVIGMFVSDREFFKKWQEEDPESYILGKNIWRRGLKNNKGGINGTNTRSSKALQRNDG